MLNRDDVTLTFCLHLVSDMLGRHTDATLPNNAWWWLRLLWVSKMSVLQSRCSFRVAQPLLGWGCSGRVCVCTPGPGATPGEGLSHHVRAELGEAPLGRQLFDLSSLVNF